MGTSPRRGLGERCPLHWPTCRPQGWHQAGRTGRAVGRLAGWPPSAAPPPSCHFEGPPRTEQGGRCGGSPDRAVNWGNRSSGRLRAALRAGRTKAAFQPWPPCWAEAPRGPQGHGWPVQSPLPSTPWKAVVGPLAGQSGASRVQPGWSEQAEGGWGSCSPRRSCPRWPPPSPPPLSNCFFRRRPASEATWQLLWPIPSLGEPPLGEASGQSCGGQGPGD